MALGDSGKLFAKFAREVSSVCVGAFSIAYDRAGMGRGQDDSHDGLWEDGWVAIVPYVQFPARLAALFFQIKVEGEADLRDIELWEH